MFHAVFKRPGEDDLDAVRLDGAWSRADVSSVVFIATNESRSPWFGADAQSREEAIRQAKEAGFDKDPSVKGQPVPNPFPELTAGLDT